MESNMTGPKQLTEETPETPRDLDSRDLILASSGDIQTGPGKKILTEDLPQEEDMVSESGSPSLQILEG